MKRTHLRPVERVSGSMAFIDISHGGILLVVNVSFSICYILLNLLFYVHKLCVCNIFIRHNNFICVEINDEF